VDRKNVTLIVLLLALPGFLVLVGGIFFLKGSENPRTFEYGGIAANITSGFLRIQLLQAIFKVLTIFFISVLI
jgi:hypothetical protein